MTSSLGRYTQAYAVYRLYVNRLLIFRKGRIPTGNVRIITGFYVARINFEMDSDIMKEDKDQVVRMVYLLCRCTHGQGCILATNYHTLPNAQNGCVCAWGIYIQIHSMLRIDLSAGWYVSQWVRQLLQPQLTTYSR